jgi:hypothetical protein
MNLEFLDPSDMQRRAIADVVGRPELAGDKGKAPYYGEDEESYRFQTAVLESLKTMNTSLRGGQDSIPTFLDIATHTDPSLHGTIDGDPPRKKFSPMVERILRILRVGHALYTKVKNFIGTVVANNWGYTAIFFILLFLLMLYPLIDLIWYLIMRAVIALAITLLIRVAHGYCTKLLKRKDSQVTAM